MTVGGAAASGLLVCAGLALAAASYSDPAGDHNDAPDITSVQVSEAPDGLVTITIGMRNYQALPSDSWINVWFDLDSNQNTGDFGDETLVRYVSTGEVELYDFDGFEMVARTAPGISGRFESGVLTLGVPKADLGGDTVFDVLAVSSRSQALGGFEFIASDYAPDRGRSAYTGPAQATFPDPGNDEDAAPDITSVRVSDTPDGWITFAISTPNYARLPVDSVLAVAVDQDNRFATGDGGSEVLVRSIAGEVALERWDPRARAWVDDTGPMRARTRNTANLVTLELHRSELGDAPRIGFSITSADVNTQAESVLAVDIAPDSGGYYRYTFANKPTLRLVTTRLFATPARPRAGKPFAVNLAVRRSDTNRGITSGAVTCRARIGGTAVRARGSVAAGAARCSLAVPSTATGRLLRGSIAVRVEGKSVSADFAYVVRS